MTSHRCEKTTLIASPFSTPLLPSFTYFISFLSQQHTTGSVFHLLLSQTSFFDQSIQAKYQPISTLFYKPIWASRIRLDFPLYKRRMQKNSPKTLKKKGKSRIGQQKYFSTFFFNVSEVKLDSVSLFELDQVPSGFEFVGRNKGTNLISLPYKQLQTRTYPFSDSDLLPLQYNDTYFHPDSWHGLDNHLFISQKSLVESTWQWSQNCFHSVSSTGSFQFIGWRESLSRNGMNTSLVRRFQVPPGFCIGPKPYGLTYSLVLRRQKRCVNQFYHFTRSPWFIPSPNFFALSSSYEAVWNRWFLPIHKQIRRWGDMSRSYSNYFVEFTPKQTLKTVGFNKFLFETNMLESGLGPTKSFIHWKSPPSLNKPKFSSKKFEQNVQQARHNLKASTVVSNEIQGFWFSLFLTRKHRARLVSMLPAGRPGVTLPTQVQPRWLNSLFPIRHYSLKGQSSRRNMETLSSSSKWLHFLYSPCLFSQKPSSTTWKRKDRIQRCNLTFHSVGSERIMRRLSLLYDRLLYFNDSSFSSALLPRTNFFLIKKDEQNKSFNQFAIGFGSNLVWYINSPPIKVDRVKKNYLFQTTFGVSIRTLLNYATFFV